MGLAEWRALDRDIKEWLRSLAVQDGSPRVPKAQITDSGADYLVAIATDGTLAAALVEIAATEPELAG